MKKCFKCKLEKPETEFYGHPEMNDGRLGKCKECTKADVRENRKKKAEYYKQKDKERANLPHRVEARKIYQASGAGRITGSKAKIRWIEHNPVKRAAQVKLGNALKGGKIKKPPCCEQCNSKGRIHGHHDDYAKPLNVRWLCALCHSGWHKIHGEGKNARQQPGAPDASR